MKSTLYKFIQKRHKALLTTFFLLMLVIPISFKNSLTINTAEAATQAEADALRAKYEALKAKVLKANQDATNASQKANDNYNATCGGMTGETLSPVDCPRLRYAMEDAANQLNVILPQNTDTLERINAAEDQIDTNYDAANTQYDGLAKLSGDSQKSADAVQGYADRKITTPSSSPTGCSLLPSSFDAQKCFTFLFAITAYFIIWLASWVLGMAGLILDQVMKYSLVDMSANLRGITGINIAWQAFRDIANMSFIFILLYIGISTIINGASGKTNGMLRNVIIVAVLINFSLFFTKVIIDISNILALGFYNGIVNQGGGTGFTISTAFMKPLGLTSIFNIGSSATALADKGFQYVIIMGIGGTAFILTAAFTFLFAAGLFLIRFAVIIILLLLSPLAYAGQILPTTQSQAKKWWDSLMGQVIFAPAYMLMLWGVLKIVNNGLFGTNTSTTGFADALAGTTNAGQLGGVGGASNVGIIVNFVIIIILLNACVIIAKTFAGRSGSFVNKAIGKAEGYARRWTTDAGKSVGGVPVNIGQRVARSSVGYIGKEIGKKYDNIEARLRQNQTLTNTVGAIPFGSTIAKAVSRSARDSIKGIENVKFGTKETYADVRKANLERDKSIASLQRENDTKETIKAGSEFTGIPKDSRTAEQQVAIDKMEQAINRLTDKEIEEYVDRMGADKFAKSDMVSILSVRQLQALNKSDKFTEGEKAAIVEARLKPLSVATTEAEGLRNLGVLNATQQKRLADLDGDIKKQIRAINDQEMEIVGNKILENKEMEAQAIKHMTGGQFDGIQKSNAFTRSQKASIKEAREKPLKNAFAAGDTAAMASILRGMKANDIAKLDKDILKDSKTVSVLTPAMMNKFTDELEPSVLKDIGDQINAIGPTHAAHKFINNGKTAEFFK